MSQPPTDRDGPARPPGTLSTRVAGVGTVAIVIAVIVVVTLAVTAQPAPRSSAPIEIPDTMLQGLASIPSTTLSRAATHHGTGIDTPTPLTQPRLTSGGRPEVLYVGAEFCAACAAERWPIVVALSRFGTFSRLEGITSTTQSVYPSIASFTFSGMRYTSRYLTFVAVEEYSLSRSADGGYAPLATPTAAERALLARIVTGPDQVGTLPVLDLANASLVVGSQFNPGLLEHLSRSSVAGAAGSPQPGTPTSADSPEQDPGTAIDAAAATLVTQLCALTGQRPATACR